MEINEQRLTGMDQREEDKREHDWRHRQSPLVMTNNSCRTFHDDDDDKCAKDQDSRNIQDTETSLQSALKLNRRACV